MLRLGYKVGTVIDRMPDLVLPETTLQRCSLRQRRMKEVRLVQPPLQPASATREVLRRFEVAAIVSPNDYVGAL